MSNSKRRRSGGDTLPAAVESVQRRIEHWRTTREKRTHMPAALWQAAADVARNHGLWFVSRALRVNYESLKKHAGSPPEEACGVPGFVELPHGSLLSQPGPSTTILELSGEDGTKLSLRLEGQGHDSLDVEALVAAFWGYTR